LSVADAWIAATAVVHDTVLVHKDPGMLSVTGLHQEHLGKA
jgi:predicted nucleic acid-binding protein